MTNPDKHMPDEIFVFNDKSSIGDFGFTSMSPKYGYIKYNRASPHQCCGARGKEACTRYDQDGEECGRGVDDDLQKAIDYWKPRIHEVSPRMGFYIQTLITHALKTREKPVEVTQEQFNAKIKEFSHINYPAKTVMCVWPNGIKIIDGGA